MTVFRLVVLPRPIFRGAVVVHAPLDNCVRDGDNPAQKVREVPVFGAVGFVAHGVIIAQSEKR